MNAKVTRPTKRRTIIRAAILAALTFSVVGLPVWSSLAKLSSNSASIQPPSNTAPVANPDSRSTSEDAGIAFRGRSLTNNDTDANADSLVVTEVNASTDTHGTVSFSRDAAFAFGNSVDIGNSSYATASGDLNGDGRSDLV